MIFRLDLLSRFNFDLIFLMTRICHIEVVRSISKIKKSRVIRANRGSAAMLKTDAQSRVSMPNSKEKKGSCTPKTASQPNRKHFSYQLFLNCFFQIVNLLYHTSHPQWLTTSKLLCTRNSHTLPVSLHLTWNLTLQFWPSGVPPHC